MHGTINVKSPNNISKWQMGFNSAFIGLKVWKMKKFYLNKRLKISLKSSFNILKVKWNIELFNIKQSTRLDVIDGSSYCSSCLHYLPLSSAWK
jgi:hypothetical protein